MTATLRRLQSYGLELPNTSVKGMRNWSFTRAIRNKQADFFCWTVQNHHLLGLEYSIHCTQLAHDLLHKHPSELSAQFETALLMAELLEQVYLKYLNVPYEVVNMRKDQHVYRAFLAQDSEENVTEVDSVSKSIRTATVTANWWRLTALRLRRFLIVISTLENDINQSFFWLDTVEKYAAPAVAYLGWIFFAPRLFTNLFLTAKHLIPGSWMDQQETALGWQIRLGQQMERRWFELANDSLWFISGLINCFVLTGVLAPFSLYVNVAMQAYDLLLASIRYYLEVSRLLTLKGEYEEILLGMSENEPDYAQVKDYLSHLQQRIAHEKKRLIVQVINTSILLIAALLAMPILAAIFPALPIVGAFLALSVTAACYAAVRWVDSEKPKDKIKKPERSNLVANSLFTPARIIDTADNPPLLVGREIERGSYSFEVLS